MADFLNPQDIDFNALKTSIKEFLKNQEQFRDWNFEASNLSVLLDILASNSELLAYYLNMVASEQFLDTAKLRESVVSHAKELNYVPRSKTSAIVNAKLIIEPHDNPLQIFVPKYYTIKTTYENKTLTFILPNEAVIKNVGGVFESEYMAFYEGVVVTEYFDGGQSYYPLSSENIDTSSIEVFIDGVQYEHKENLFGLDSSSKIFFVEGYGSNQYQVVFGNDIFGVKPKIGQEIKIVYRDTLGSLGNNLSKFSSGGPIDGYDAVTVSIEAPSYGGSEEETINDIRYNATRHFQLRARAVTAEDYAIFVKEKFPQIQAVAAYGGEDVTPPLYGKVVIALKPYGAYTTVTERLKNSIKNFLSDKNITAEPVIVDPEYMYIGITSEVQCDLGKVSSLEDVKSKVEKAIIDLNNTELSDFNRDLRYSKLLSTIDSSDPSIVSNDTEIRLIRKWIPIKYQPYNIKFIFMNALDVPQPQHEFDVYHEGVVYSNLFNAKVDGIEYQNVFLRDNGLGRLDLIEKNGDILTLQKTDIGKVDYETGEILFTLTVTDFDKSIKIYGKPRNADVLARENAFLVIDGEDVTITAIEQKT